jgi:hypothetical protein
MPLSTRRSFTRRTPRGLFGSIGLIAVFGAPRQDALEPASVDRVVEALDHDDRILAAVGVGERRIRIAQIDQLLALHDARMLGVVGYLEPSDLESESPPSRDQPFWF